MPTRVVQERFGSVDLGPYEIAVHAHPSGCRRLIVFVHGLGGSGYGTWGEFPAFCFESAKVLVDVGIFSYPSFWRRFGRCTLALDQVVELLCQELKALSASYDDIFLVGHSLGGIVSEMAVKRTLGLNPAESLTAIAGIFVMGAPRAGSGLAVRAASRVFTDLSVLYPFNNTATELEEFFQSLRVESRLSAVLEPGRTLLPRFAGYGASDKIVRKFSAVQSIPTEHRGSFDATHRSLVKPLKIDDNQVVWLIDWLEKVCEVRKQARRNLQFAEKQRSKQLVGEAVQLVTEFSGPLGSARWEEAFVSALRDTEVPDVEIRDKRDVTADLRSHLLVTVAEAAVVGTNPAEQTRVLTAHERCVQEHQLTLGIAAQGDQAVQAVIHIQGWLPSPPSNRCLLEAAPTFDELRQVISRWLQIVGSRMAPRPVDPVGFGNEFAGGL